MGLYAPLCTRRRAEQGPPDSSTLGLSCNSKLSGLASSQPSIR